MTTAVACSGEIPSGLSGFDVPQHQKGLALVALFQQFSHAEDGLQTGGRSGSDFQVNQFICFAENVPPLRVPDDDIGAAAVNQHFWLISPVKAPFF